MQPAALEGRQHSRGQATSLTDTGDRGGNGPREEELHFMLQIKFIP